ncbi:hypothetical protein, partial [Klebsiella pneumoniae]|uniref:hypothetical protein n=1 Tax=Klebsiella pneumoniae TaxID=573 RepID=UPI004055662D
YNSFDNSHDDFNNKEEPESKLSLAELAAKHQTFSETNGHADGPTLGIKCEDVSLHGNSVGKRDAEGSDGDDKTEEKVVEEPIR